MSDAEAVLRAYGEAFGRGDIDAVVGLYAARTDYRQPFAPMPLTSPDAVRAFESGMFSGFSAITLDIEWLVGSGNEAAAGVVIRATHTGPMPLRTLRSDEAALNRVH